MVSLLVAPIPGQSLTDEPKNYPWERPPAIVDVGDAIKYHINRVADENVVDNLYFALELGIPLKILTESMMTAAEGEGVHDIDVSIIVEPILRNFIKKNADIAGVEYKETFDVEDDTVERARILMDAVEQTPEKEKDEGFALLEEMAAAEENEEKKKSDKPRGLMER